MKDSGPVSGDRGQERGNISWVHHRVLYISSEQRYGRDAPRRYAGPGSILKPSRSRLVHVWDPHQGSGTHLRPQRTVLARAIAYFHALRAGPVGQLEIFFSIRIDGNWTVSAIPSRVEAVGTIYRVHLRFRTNMQ